MAVAKKRSHKHLYILVVLVVLVATVAILEATNTTHFFHKSAVVSAPPKPITSLPKQPATNKASSNSSTIQQGTANDENGKVPSSGVPTSPSQWATSESGVITLKLPVSNTTIKSGATLTGTSTVNPVQYRLIDSQDGVIAQGPLNVVNGNFTATLNFQPYSSSGQLDVFNTDANGKEINEVQIPVNF